MRLIRKLFFLFVVSTLMMGSAFADEPLVEQFVRAIQHTEQLNKLLNIQIGRANKSL